MTRHTTVRVAFCLACLAFLALAGCAEPATPTAPAAGPSADSDLVPDGYTGDLTASGTVLANEDHGPQLCFAVDESYPPQCGGPEVVGWSWADVRHESAGGSRWGEYRVVGSWDGERLTLTEAPGPPRWNESGASDPLPCPEPEGGWEPPDPEIATQTAFDEAVGVARSSEGFAGLWIDQGIRQAQLTEATANDPQRLVLVVTSTGDLAALEAEIRGVWGGNLSVAPAGRSQAELRPALKAVRDLPGFVSSAYDEVGHHVDVTLAVATEQL